MKAKISDSFIKSISIPIDKPYEICDEKVKGFRLVVRPSGAMSFVYCYRNREHRWLRYTVGKYGSITTVQARAIAMDLAADVRKGVDIQKEKKRERRQAKIENQKTLKNFFVNKYEPFLCKERKTGEKIAKQINSEFVEVWGDRSLATITPWMIEKWRKQKLDKVKPATTNRLLMYFKALMNKATEWDVIVENPISKVKRLKEDSKANIRYLSASEESRLRHALIARQEKKRQERINYISWCKSRKLDFPKGYEAKDIVDHLSPMVLIALNTGMRRGEIFSLFLSDINLKQKIITVNGYNAKSGSTRHIPMNSEAFSTVVKWINQKQPSDLLFENPNTGLKYNNIDTSWKNLLKAAAIENFRFHDLRHTFASKLTMSGVDLYTVKELLGHSTIELTQRYAHLSVDHKFSAVELL